MMKTALQSPEIEHAGAEAPARDEHIAPAPRVSIQAFCESVETAAAIQAAGEDRRLAKAHLKIQMGGITAAVEAYNGSSTPKFLPMLEYAIVGGIMVLVGIFLAVSIRRSRRNMPPLR